jgi:hypothetical protein
VVVATHDKIKIALIWIRSSNKESRLEAAPTRCRQNVRAASSREKTSMDTLIDFKPLPIRIINLSYFFLVVLQKLILYENFDLDQCHRLHLGLIKRQNRK